MRGFVLMLALATAVSGCASWTETTISDTRMLAGTWKGYAHGQNTQGQRGQPVPLTVTIRENGSYQAQGARTVDGTITANGGKGTYSSTGSSGTVKYFKAGSDREMLRFEGSSSQGTGFAEYERVK